MSLRSLLRTPSTRAVSALSDEVRRLTAAVERLEAMQRKDAEQLKKLRETLAGGTTAWSRALDIAEASAAEFRHLAEKQREAEKERQKTLERLDAGQKMDAKWRKIFNNQVSALVRHICLPLDRLEPPHALNARRFRLRSQNDEDGILFALLDRAGWGGRRFVEIGSGRSGGTAAALAAECGWSGLMIELSADAVEGIRKKFADNRGLTAVAARVTPQNVNALLTSHGYDGEVDLLSIDIDSYDYWVLEALTATSPRILVLEYNALFGPERRVTIPSDYPLVSTPKGYGGASLAALSDLAARKGYRLVTCENAGVNAFFLRNDVAPDVLALSPSQAYKPLRRRTDIEDADVTTNIYELAAEMKLPLVEM